MDFGVGQMQGNQMGQIMGQQNYAAQQVAAPLTLTRAMATLEALNKRLFDISARTHKLATVIGGPIPIQSGVSSGDGSKPTPTVMQSLNNEVDSAVRAAIEISSALEAISRSLGVTNSD